jgi:transglutaminase-like putative cysteine protease
MYLSSPVLSPGSEPLFEVLEGKSMSSRSIGSSLLVAAAAALTLVPTSCAVHPSGTPGSPRMAVEDHYLTKGKERAFRIRYLAKVQSLPAGAKALRLWWPVPSSSNLQQIEDLKFSGPQQPRIGREPKYGNQVAYVEMDSPPAEAEFEMTFTCKRREAKVALEGLAGEGTDPPGSYQVFREPDRLVIVDDEIRRRAKESTEGKSGTVAKARGIYDHVMTHMTYDKTGKGWGRGDSRFACDVGKGNCTDFHALFNSMCRASGIASGFEIGLYLPYEPKVTGSFEPAPGGYHCWAAFRVPGKTWVPVDISEADRFPERADFFFGGHTANRVTLSTGRDIVLEPPQKGEPLNYLLDPYAEVDGKPHPQAAKTWFYQDL